jgi:putative DNA primase/helicase
MFKKIPNFMKKFTQWICWDREKRPYNPKKSQPTYASVTNPDTWGSYEQAVDAYHRFRLRGIGFVFTENDPFVGVDIDNCLDPIKGTLSADALTIISLLDSYTEESPSRKGFHIIVQAKLPFRGKQGEVFEIYDHGRYFTMTGHHYEVTPLTIGNRDKEVIELIKKYFPYFPIMRSPWKK